MRRIVSPALLGLALSGCILSGAPISPYGRHAELKRDGDDVRGELLAVSPDSVWLMRESTVASYATSTLRGVNVRRHTLGMKRTLTTMAIAGAVFGGMMLSACNAYNAMPDEGDTDCGDVFPVALLSFLGGGVLYGAINEYQSKHHLLPRDTDRLRPFTRFPQGLPDSIRVISR
jgi:hypothetical protein